MNCIELASSGIRCFNDVKDQYSHGELSQKFVRDVGLNADSLTAPYRKIFMETAH